MPDKKWFKNKIKYLLCFLVYYSGLLAAFLFLFKKLKKRHSVLILCYHRIVNKNNISFLDKGTGMHCDIKLFEHQMSYLKKWYKVIPMDDLVDHLSNGKNLNTPSIVITLDDGYKDNYTLAYPVLKNHRLPATIYLTTGLIGTAKRTWFDEVESLLINTKINSFKFPQLFGDEVLDISDTRKKIEVNSRISEAMKCIDDAKKHKSISELSDILNVKSDTNRNAHVSMLNWEEVKEMSENNIIFGAHSHTHPILTKVPLEQAKYEILQSKKTIEKKLNCGIRHFAIPNGRDTDFSEELRQLCIDFGFKSIVTTNYGLNKDGKELYSLKRIGPRYPLFMFAVELARDMFIKH